MEAATLNAPALGLPSPGESGRCRLPAPDERELRTCAERASSCASQTSAAALRYRRTERTALYIETQEGDVVRLKIQMRSALHGQAAYAKGETEIAELSVSARTAVKIRFSIDGDLSADELAAIRSVVAQASGLAAEFFAGDAPEAFAAAASLEMDGAQLARVGLRLSVRDHLTYAASGTYRPLAPAAAPPAAEPVPTGPPAAAPPPEPSTGASATTAPEEPPAPFAPVEPAPAPPSDEAAFATREPSPSGSPSAVPAMNVASSALATIAQFLTVLLDSLAEPLPAEGLDGAPSIELSLKLRVFQSVALTLAATQVSAAGDAASGMPLLNDTLDALAAREQPLDTNA